MNVEIARLALEEATDFEALLHIFGDVFEREESALPDLSYLQQLLSNQAFGVVVARIKGKVIGGATAYVLPGYYTTQSTLYIYDVGISPPYQRQGVGRKIMAFLREHCAAHGIGEMYVQAEAGDPDAISFYRKTAPSNETAAVQFSYLLK